MEKKKCIKKVRNVFIILAQTLVITGITIFSVAPVSCRVTTSGIEIVGGDYSAPVLQNVSVVDEKTVILDFSEAVEITSAVVSPVLSGISDSDEHSTTKKLSPSIEAATGAYGVIECEILPSENNQLLTFKFNQGTVIGKQYEILGVVKDRIGNSLTFSVPFTGYNNRIPKIVMTEIHTGMASQTKKEKASNIRRLEYVEFLALSEGNLVGLEFCSGAYGESKKYSFPSVEVKAGEYFVLHLRNWGEGCISEEGEELNLAFSEYTNNSVRDLWIDESGKLIGDKTDILIVKNCITDRIVDAVMYRDEAVEDWAEKLKVDYSKYESLMDIYAIGGDIENAVVATGLSSTYALQRVNKSLLYSSVILKEEIEYPVQVDTDSWRIVKPSLPLKQ